MYIVDRFEECYAVLEYTDKYGEISIIKTAKDTLSSDVKEGDVVYIENGIYYTDKLATEKRRNKIRDRLNNVKKKNL